PAFGANTDTYYNSPTSFGVAGSTKFGGPGTWLNPASCTNAPTFNRTGDPSSGANLALPPGNTALKNQANPAVGGTGCMYTGPTTITLRVVGGVGKMDVVSPRTRSTNPGCAPGTGLSLPGNGVVYVQTV